MLLRSSSTPVLGSLLSSFSDSPNNNNNNHHHQSLNKSPFHHHHIGCVNQITINSCSSSPISPSIAEFSDYNSRRGLRRAHSEGNLEELAFSSCNSNSNADCPISSQPKKISGRQKCLMLETIPSFSLCNLRSRFEEEEEGYDDGGSDMVDEEESMQVAENSGLSTKMGNMVLSSEQLGLVMERSWNMGFEEERGLISEEMHLARGLGIDGGTSDRNGTGNFGGGGGGGRDEFHWTDGDGGDMQGTEEYYKKMLQENPGNPLFLRNYAQFLYQTKRDLQRAEEYYSRAILADPKDGDILSQYAKLVWELHHDLDKASSYFKRAVQASPEDSHVHAAYASFLWETEEDEDESVVPRDFDAMPPHFYEGLMASTSA
ncbi:conserved hypothetical protein [Ricinus communis]|uniref:Uncharacterized protein n=1 Tax=Ricinus communis TaxID=3988 RepID=B9SKM5_RICCO|nr:conserved hypothetical protein [Ricinus communis]|eukprot:XP_002526544.1 uncharacterized protein LOC8266710 [Ricinus communis]